MCQVHQDSDQGVSELRLRLTSLEDGGEYQCSTAQYYDYQAASTTINLRVEDTVAVIEGDSRHRYIPRGNDSAFLIFFHSLVWTGVSWNPSFRITFFTA